MKFVSRPVLIFIIIVILSLLYSKKFGCHIMLFYHASRFHDSSSNFVKHCTSARSLVHL